MENLINMITGGSTEFTPSVLVGIITFCIIWEGICRLVQSLVQGVRR